MSVIPITVFFSLGLVTFFVVLFLREQRRRFGSAERDSLLPLAAEQPRVVIAARPPLVARGLRTRSEPDRPARHSVGDGGRPGSPDTNHEAGCGCARSERPPCSGCQRHAAAHPAH